MVVLPVKLSPNIKVRNTDGAVAASRCYVSHVAYETIAWAHPPREDACDRIWVDH